MRRKLLLLLVVLFVTGCSLDELRHDDRSEGGRAFSVEEAKEFFEKDFVGLLTRSQAEVTTEKKFVGKLHPGDFTPLWDNAVYSESDGVAAYDVDILADRSIIAIRSKFGPSGAKAQRLKVYQKLVVRRNVKTGTMASYVLSLIPDVGCDDRRIPETFISRGKDKGGFSGIAVYATTDRGVLVRVQEYKNGVLKRGVYIPSGKGSYADRCWKAKEILAGMVLMSKRNILTKSGEDIWEDRWDDNDYSDLDIDDLEYYGDGIYFDDEGHYYLDIDGDGDIDLEIIAPGYVEDEMPEDPWPDGNGNGNEGGETSENGNENGEDTGNTDNLENDPSNNVDPPTVPEEPDHLPNILDLFNVGIHFTAYTETGDCLKCCYSTLDKMGQTDYGSRANVIYLVRENEDHSALIHYEDVNQYYTTVTDCINRHLDAGLAIIVGVDHTLAKGYNDGTIDHFVLIVGREYNEESGYYEYLYVETGTNSPEKGYNPDNRFVYDDSIGMYVDDSARIGPIKGGPNTYTLTELRPNDGDDTGTIQQPAKRILRFFKMIGL